MQHSTKHKLRAKCFVCGILNQIVSIYFCRLAMWGVSVRTEMKGIKTQLKEVQMFACKQALDPLLSLSFKEKGQLHIQL